MGFESVSITIDTIERVYKKAFVAKYAKQLRDGNTVCLKADISDGLSILRISHDSANGVQRHLVSVEDITTDAAGNEQQIKVHRVFSCKEGDPVAEATTETISAGLDSWLATAGVITSIVNGEL